MLFRFTSSAKFKVLDCICQIFSVIVVVLQQTVREAEFPSAKARCELRNFCGQLKPVVPRRYTT